MADEFTAKFKVDISDLKKNIEQASKAIKNANATFKSETAGMESWSKDADGLSKKLEQLKTILESQKTILTSYQDQLKKQQEAYEENGRRAESLKQKLQELASQGVSKTDAEYQKYEKALRSVLKEQANNEKACDDLKLAIIEQQGAVKQTEASIEKYTNAQKDLEKQSKSTSTTVKDQQKKLDALKKEYADVVAAEGKNSDSAKKLAKQITDLSTDLNKNKQSLSEAEKEADKLDKSIDELGDSAEKTGGKFDGMGKKLANVLKNGLLAVGAAAASAVAGLTAASVSSAEYADEILTLSTVTGVSTDALQAYGYAAELVDVSLDTLTSSMAKNVRSMSNAAKGSKTTAAAYEKLGVAVVDADGNLRDGQTVYWEAIDALGKMEEGADRDALAMEIFGKSAQELNPLIAQGSDGIAKLTAEAKEMGAVMSADTLRSLGEFDDALQRLKGGAKAAKNALGTVLLPALKNLAEDGTKLLQKFTSGLVEANGDWSKISKVVGETIGELADTLLDEVPNILEIGTSIVTSLASAIVKALPKLVESAGSVIETLIKTIVGKLPDLITMIATIIKSLLEELGRALPEIVTEIVKIVPMIVKSLAAAIPDLLDGAINFLMAIVQAIPTIVEELLKELPTIITTILNTLSRNSSKVLNGAVQLFKTIITAIGKIVVEIAKAMPDIIKAIVEGLSDGISDVFAAAGELFFGIVDRARVAREAIEKQNDAIYELADAMKNTAPQLADYNKLLSEQGNTISDLDSMIGETENAITEVLRKALKEQRGLRDEDIQSIEEYMKKLSKLQSEKLEIYRSQQLSELKKLQLESNTITREEAAQHVANVREALEQANRITEEAYTSRLTMIEQKHQAEGTIGSKAYKDELTAAKKAHDDQIAENRSYYTEAMEIVEKHAYDWVKTDATMWKRLSEDVSKHVDALNKPITDFIKLGDLESWQDYLNAKSYSKADYLETISKIDRKSAQGFLQMVAEIKKGGGVLDAETQEIVKNMLTAFDNLPSDLDNAGKDALLGMVYGMEDVIPQLKNTSTMTANDIVDTIKNYLGIASPSKVMREVGENTAEGLIEGMLSRQTALIEMSRKMAESMTETFVNSVKNIMETVKGTENEFEAVGAKLADSLGLGFVRQMQNATLDIQNALPRAAANDMLSQLQRPSESASVSNSVTNFTQNIYAPQQPSRIDLYRQTKNLLALAGRGI